MSEKIAQPPEPALCRYLSSPHILENGATQAPAPEIDYYALLSIPPAATESEIRRAYRKTSILYHPDKVEPTPANLDKFHQLQIALNTLTDPEEKAKYDQGRQAKLRRKAENDALDLRTRQLKEDLERREAEGARANGNGATNGVKRAWSERELEINRIREENRRRMAEMGAARVRERERREREAEAAAAAEAEAAEEQERESSKTSREDAESKVDDAQPYGKPNNPSTPASDDELQRCVKVRWFKGSGGLDIDQEALEDRFPAGEVESVVILKDKKKKRRIDGGNDKVVMGTAVIVFSTLAAAKAAVKAGPWVDVESVEWAVRAGSED
ncbi:Pre-mRNA-splicing factor cwf23 [Cyphellophora attinorum]|uniref:Pre-mRNA-splicing factor cwf23 n=1 Tax=Cyphellophora attinorum TaxID=1664694 RepID=A0A0N1GXQ5_9EURO|nr:Pre-mRNA-splicing factor cwf23 [Phialophora attinorum]KPI35126.1 Pre-mRNA-splicing factor cwf23 [Phialophora attinorum]